MSRASGDSFGTERDDIDRPCRVLTADSVGKRFWGRSVLESASLWVEKGRITALFGRNGAGKTTLLRIAAGDMRPDYGTVTFRGEVHRRAWQSRLARDGLFFLPDRGLLVDDRTVRWHLEAVTERFAGGGDWRGRTRCLDVAPLLDRRVESLSSGERRRAELSVALARSPVCLLADEPLRGIAPMEREDVLGALEQLRERGCGVVVSGHEAPALLELADSVVWLTAGTTHWLGSPERARSHPEFVARYLGPASLRPLQP